MFNGITESELKDKGIQGLPDVPGLSTAAMQAKFDELVLDVVVPKFNELIGLLNGIGISEKKIVEAINNSNDEVPTSAALIDYLSDLGAGDMLKSVYDADNTGIVDNAEKLGGVLPEEYLKKVELLKTIADLKANSTAGYGVDALVVKEINNNLSTNTSVTFTSADGILDKGTVISIRKDGSNFLKYSISCGNITCNANVSVKLGTMSHYLSWKTLSAVVLTSGGGLKGIATIIIYGATIYLISNIAITSTDYIVCAN